MAALRRCFREVQRPVLADLAASPNQRDLIACPLFDICRAGFLANAGMSDAAKFADAMRSD